LCAFLLGTLAFLLVGCGAEHGIGAGGNSAGSAGGSAAGGASGSANEDGSKRLRVACTIFPEYDFARAIAGGLADVSMLTDPGASVHSFDPSPADIREVQDADVFIYVGGESDVWADSILASLDTSNMKIVRLMDYVDVYKEELKEGMTPEEDEETTPEDRNADKRGNGIEGASVGAGENESESVGASKDADKDGVKGTGTGTDANADAKEVEYDEHVWTSPKNAILLIDAIRDALCEADDAHAEVYADNAAAYKEKLVAIDETILELVQTAKRNKIIVADKFPFRYFVEQYGLDYAAAFPGCSDQTDAGAATIAYLIRSVTEEKIPYIYYVELSNQSVAGAIAEQTGAEMLLLNSGENISKDDFNAGVTYVDLMNQNIENLRKGLTE
jgi:zinc transport system substrate-binding protein